MENFTIHIFGYGETQINSKEFSVKVVTTTLQTVTPLVDAIWSKKPEGSIAEENYHVVNLFGYNDIRWVSKDGFKLKDQQDLVTFIDDLIAELRTAYDSLPKKEVA
jgi:hypothetical protein